MKGIQKPARFRFPAIATFGIGFISVLTRVSSLRLVTRPVGSEDHKGLKIQLDANLRDAMVEKALDCPLGTSVFLKIKDRKYLDGIEDYLLQTFHYPSVNIRFVDWDYLESIYALARSHRLLLPEQADTLARAGEFLRTFRGDIVGMLNRLFQVTEAAGKNVEDKVARSVWQTVPGGPPFTIYGQEPEALPTSSAWCFFLGNDSEIKSCERLNKEFTIRDAAAMVVVPVQFIDKELGIEWRSLHSFLLVRGVITRRIFFASIDRDETFIDQACTASFDPYVLIEMMSSYPSAREEYQNPDSPDWSGPMVLSDQRGIRRYLEVDFESPEDWSYAPIEDFFFTYFQGHREAMDTLSWFLPWREKVYQDGILLPIVISDIAPVGTAVGVANLLGESRLGYNLSRNALDQSEERLRRWRSKVSVVVLGRIGDAVREALDKLDATYHWKDLWTGGDKDPFSRLPDWLDLEHKKHND
jgi:hypothetical protein